MSCSCGSSSETLCGCCAGVVTETPEVIYNRPGLSSISYRVGTQTAFKASLLAALSSSALPALAPLTTRDNSDFSIALLDAWAVALDILSFYQERIANESYLRTAVDAASVFNLAELVGYQPSPGVAASAYLAFTLTSTAGSPDNVLIPAGTRVQSVPGPGQTPQVFETSADITAVIAQNAIPPQTTVPWTLNPPSTSLWIAGASNNINAGDGLLFVNQALHDAASAGVAAPSNSASDFHFVTAATTDPTSGNTLIAWDTPLKWPIVQDSTASIYVFRKKAALFGVNAPDPRTLSTSSSNVTTLNTWPPGGKGDWVFENAYNTGSMQINLDASYPIVVPGKGGEPSWTILISPDYTALYQIAAAADTGPVNFTLTSKTTQLTLANAQTLVNNIDAPASLAALWNAFYEAIYAVELDFITFQDPTVDLELLFLALSNLSLAIGPVDGDTMLQAIVSQTRSAVAYIQSVPLTPANPPYLAWSYQSTYTRQTGLLKPVEGSSLELVTGEQISSGQPVAVSGKRLRLQVGSQTDSAASFVPNGAIASQPLTPGQIFLVDAFPPAAITGGTDQLWQVITIDGVAGDLTIAPGNLTLLPSVTADPVTGESVVVSTANYAGPILTLGLAQSLARIYDRATVSVNANTVAATQGETMNEILGSGDATNQALQFTLKQSPLTYTVSSNGTGMGAQSTLQVWVNNLKWSEVDNFLASGPNDRVYATQTDSSANTTVEFGDGIEGARTPTGQMNIRAVYRKGIGSAGNVQSGQLSQALDRPQGLKSVTNPDAATGGADPDTAADARVSAPLQVLTIGRVVSLEDYQNYAQAFAGISKALATWTWTGRSRQIFLTVAGANGLVFQSDDPTILALKKTLWAVGNPNVPIQIASYQPMPFELAAQVLVDTSTYDTTLVLAQVWQSLVAAFSFSQRQLGQGVAQSEIVELIQQTPGVLAVQMTKLFVQGDPPALNDVLRAASPIPGQTATPQAAQMLLLDPASQGKLGVWS